MEDKPAPKPADDTYTDEEAARRTDATIRAMIGMKPKPHAKAGKRRPTASVAKRARGSAGKE